jgi:hypothetical protein
MPGKCGGLLARGISVIGTKRGSTASPTLCGALVGGRAGAAPGERSSYSPVTMSQMSFMMRLLLSCRPRLL